MSLLILENVSDLLFFVCFVKYEFEMYKVLYKESIDIKVYCK